MIKRNGNAIRMRKEGAETNPYVGKGDFLLGAGERKRKPVLSAAGTAYWNLCVQGREKKFS